MYLIRFMMFSFIRLLLLAMAGRLVQPPGHALMLSAH